MAKEKICGIYCIENLVNHKKYIGLSKNILQRFSRHRTHLNGGYHINDHLQSAWNNYGEDNFQFYIIEECDESLLKDKEMYYIKKYKTKNRLYGYNKTAGGDGVKELSEESSEKISLSETLYPVVCIGFDGKFIKEYRNCREAADFHNGRTENIRQCCNKTYGYKSQYGYIWMYKDDYLNNGVCLSDYKKQHRSKSVDVYDLYGTFIDTYENARIVESELGIPYKNVSQVCNGQKRQSHGYICRFHGESFDKYSVTRKDGNIKALR